MSLAASDLRLLWEDLRACVCGDNNLSTPAGDRGWGRWALGSSTGLELSWRALEEKGAGGARLTPTEYSTEKGASGPERAALAGADVQLLQVVMVAPWGEGSGWQGAGGDEASPSPRSARCLPSRYFLRSRRWTLFTTPESFSCSSFRSCSLGGGMLGGLAPCPRAALRPPAPGSISLPPPPPLGPPQPPAWRRRWGRRRQQRRQQREETENLERRPRRWPLTQTHKLIGGLWRAGRKRKRPTANGRRAPGTHPLVWEGEQLKEAELAGWSCRGGRSARPDCSSPLPAAPGILCAGAVVRPRRRAVSHALARLSLLRLGIFLPPSVLSSSSYSAFCELYSGVLQPGSSTWAPAAPCRL